MSAAVGNLPGMTSSKKDQGKQDPGRQDQDPGRQDQDYADGQAQVPGQTIIDAEPPTPAKERDF
jgi:hypothetical protein